MKIPLAAQAISQPRHRGNSRCQRSVSLAPIANGICLMCMLIGAPFAHSSETAVLGTPAKGSTISGVSVISGYHCTSKNIEVFIDGVSIGLAGAGTTLLGTQAICGRVDTGFALLYNFNNLTEGNHVVSAYANGQLIGSNTIYSVRSGGEPWLSGVSKQITTLDFPVVGDQATLEWSQPLQNFVVTEISRLGSSGEDLSSLAGRHRGASISTSFTGSCSGHDLIDDVEIDIVTDGNVATLKLFDCTLTLGNASGNPSSGFTTTGTATCYFSNGTGMTIKASSERLRYDAHLKELRGDLYLNWGGDLIHNCRERLSFH